MPWSAAPAKAADPPGSAVTGSVYLDGSGRGIGNVEVTLKSDGQNASRRSGPDGSFAFANLRPGRYSISVILPAGYRAATAPSVSVVIEGRKVITGIGFGIAPLAEPTPTPAPKPTAPPASQTSSTDAAVGAQQQVPVPVPDRTQGRPAPSGPSAENGVGAAPSPSASLAQPGSPSPGPLATSASPSASSSTEDILAGRGLHWSPGQADPVLTLGTPSQTGLAPAGRPSSGDAAAGRTRVTSLEPLRHVPASQVRSWSNDSSLWLGVPFKTQIDGTPFSLVNCGPASLAMVLSAFGMPIDPAYIRDYVNHLTGDYSTDDGTSLEVLARVAREAGLNTFGPLYGWSINAIREQVRAGHPVITLVKYRSLPGHGTSLAEFDHYIVITGLAGEDFIYNDAAFATDYGYNLLITPGDLERAWSFSSIPRHAVGIGLGDSLRPLPNAPRQLTAASLALGPLAQQPAGQEPPLRMIPGPATEWLHEQMLAEVGARSSVPDTRDGGEPRAQLENDFGDSLPARELLSERASSPMPSSTKWASAALGPRQN